MTNREDQLGPQLRLRGGLLAALVLGDGVEDRLDVGGLGQAGGGHGARRGAQLEVDDAVGGEVAQHRERRVAQRRRVVDQAVDVGREEREEAAGLGWFWVFFSPLVSGVQSTYTHTSSSSVVISLFLSLSPLSHSLTS